MKRKEYCKVLWIRHEKVKWSEVWQDYYFDIKDKTYWIQTNYPCYANKDNDVEVIKKIVLYLNN